MVTLRIQIFLITACMLVALGWQWYRLPAAADLWLTPDQQGRIAYEALDFPAAATLFEDPGWAGTANYDAGQYTSAAANFSKIETAAGPFNQGNAMMKAREYARAISAFELAVKEAPDWQAAHENLALARYTRDYIENAREEGDTGDESELGADGYQFDNQAERGRDMVITNESVMQAASAEKWMRSVNTETREFLQMRFSLEAAEP